MLKCKHAELENTSTLILNEGPVFAEQFLFARVIEVFLFPWVFSFIFVQL